MSTIAVIGLGNMGHPMAGNLARAGHDVVGYDVVVEARDAAARDGLAVAQSPTAAVKAADVVITMLPAGAIVLDVYGEVLDAVPAGALLIDCSTIDVPSSRTAHDRANEAGHLSVDAPVSGGVVGAEAASLTFMVGGTAAAVAAATPILEAMGKRVVLCGGPGAGQAAKICNNMILGISMIAVSEAFVLGEKLGLDHQAFFDVASTASGQCWALTTNCPVPGPVPTSPANRNFQGGFGTRLMLKDIGLATAAAEENGVPTVLGHLAKERYEEFLERDGRNRDFSSIIEDIRGAVR